MIIDCTAAVNVIRKLADEPSLSAEELKYAFDEAAQNIKDWMNDEFIPCLREEFALKQDLIGATPNRVLVTDENGNVVSGEADIAEIAHLTDVKDNIQKQIDELSQSKQSVISWGSEPPEGGNNGDIYIQYVEE